MKEAGHELRNVGILLKRSKQQHFSPKVPRKEHSPANTQILATYLYPKYYSFIMWPVQSINEIIYVLFPLYIFKIQFVFYSHSTSKFRQVLVHMPYSYIWLAVSTLDNTVINTVLEWQSNYFHDGICRQYFNMENTEVIERREGLF